MVKQRIIEEALALFVQTGVKSITMDDIARHLGISKRTIYENFKDKEELLIACIDALHKKVTDNYNKMFREAENVVGAVLSWMQISAEPAAQRQINMMTDIRKYYPQVFQEHLTRFNIDKLYYIEQLINRGIDEGVFRTELNSEIIATAICIDNNSGTFSNSVFEKFSFTDFFENTIITFLRGMCTPKGIEIIEKYKNKITYR